MDQKRGADLKNVKWEKMPLKPFLWLDKYKTERHISASSACSMFLFDTQTNKRKMCWKKNITFIIVVNRVSRTMWTLFNLNTGFNHTTSRCSRTKTQIETKVEKKATQCNAMQHITSAHTDGMEEK